jgi:hypothetical protein
MTLAEIASHETECLQLLQAVATSNNKNKRNAIKRKSI